MAQTPAGTAFTYQGQLKQAGLPVSNTADFQFTLWDAAGDGNQIASTIAADNVNVVNGLFTVTLDFGAGTFTGDARWLEIAVRSPAGSGTYTTLSPRQALTATPYALFARAPWRTGSCGVLSYGDGSVGIGTPSPGSPLTVAGLIETTSGGVKFPDGTVQTSALTAGAAGGRNPLQIALLRWYEGNQTGATFTVGSGPWGVAFDGANIWVTNHGSNSVTKLRASDGALLGTFTAGINPYGVVFDGANIWVANYGTTYLTKLRASDGALLGTFTVGSGSMGVAFDGANIWVTNYGDNNVTKL
jgi:hypothetical protein